MSDTVTLDTGQEHPTPLVTATMMNLRSLMEDHPIAAYELVELCRDPTHRLFGNTGDVLRERGLLEGDGQPHQAVKEIVLASVAGKDASLTFANPVRRGP